MEQIPNFEALAELTLLQQKVGYTKGNINTVALLGLFGEAGEVLDECWFNRENPELLNIYEKDIIVRGIKVASIIDDLKKEIRNKNREPLLTHIFDGNEEKFDMEMADVLYYLNALAINRGKTLYDYAALSVDKVKAHVGTNKHVDISHGA